MEVVGRWVDWVVIFARCKLLHYEKFCLEWKTFNCNEAHQNVQYISACTSMS